MNTSAGRVYGGDVANHIFVKLHLENGSDLIFAVDTGSPFTILDKSLEPELGKPIGTRRLNYASFEDLTANKYKSPKFYLGNTPLQLGDSVVTDNVKRLMSGRPVAGVLGMDCLRHYCIQLDFTTRKIRFIDSDSLQAKQLGKPFPLVHIGSNLSTHMDFHGKNERFRLDTGDITDGVLQPKLLKDTVKAQKPVRTFQIKTISGALEQWSYFSAFDLGSETYTNMLMRQISNKGNESILGLRFLARNLVTLDFPNRTMYLKQASVGPLANENGKINSGP